MTLNFRLDLDMVKENQHDVHDLDVYDTHADSA